VHQVEGGEREAIGHTFNGLPGEVPLLSLQAAGDPYRSATLVTVSSPHDTLGVGTDASADEIKVAYRILTRIYDPSRYADSSAALRAEAERRTAEVKAAYRTLMAFAVVDVVYGTEGWTNHERGRLTEALLDAEIPHEWNGSEVTVARGYERVVERIMTQRG
jgi:hypothetical protein